MHAAMADETLHARLAFGLAGAYAGEAIGPGRLAIDSCLDDRDLAAIIATVVHEGCVGETVAAIEAREAMDAARDPVVKDVLATIATANLPSGLAAHGCDVSTLLEPSS